ncbi:MAG: MFS transporter [Phenylobacterium sp.]|uniref:MFS transporter n=1 Tax=Phenylobacterium sp. TaxID=1871053 RepID=UPI0027368F21|nr:MFS transporter [Phenylobacterium sp.]MDP3173603.1 MFS transporter [Phenylobacterium sp.]
MTDSEGGLPTPRRHWAMLALSLSIALAVLDGAVATVALPVIARDMQISDAASIWIVNASQLVMMVTLMPLAALGDRIGYRRIYQTGVVVFSLASLGAALSQTLPELIAARMLQGLGASGIMSLNAAMVRLIWPHRQLGRGMGVMALIVTSTSTAAPAIGSLVLGVASWHWLFAMNVPLGIAATVVGAFALPATPGSDRTFDWRSAVLTAATFGLLVVGLRGLGADDVRPALAELAGALAVGVVLVRRELGMRTPLLPLDLIRIPIIGLSALTAIMSFSAQTMGLVALPFLLQGTMGRTTVETGLLLTAWALATTVMAPVAGRLADRYPAGVLGGIGLAVMACGLLLIGLQPPTASNFDLAWPLAVCGVGFGFYQTPNNRTIMISAPLERSGGAAGLVASARVLGQTLGSISVALMFHSFSTGAPRMALFVGACVAAVGSGISLTRLRAPAATS